VIIYRSGNLICFDMPHDLNVTSVYISGIGFWKIYRVLSIFISVHGNKISDRLSVLYRQNTWDYRISEKSSIGPALKKTTADLRLSIPFKVTKKLIIFQSSEITAAGVGSIMCIIIPSQCSVNYSSGQWYRLYRANRRQVIIVATIMSPNRLVDWF